MFFRAFVVNFEIWLLVYRPKLSLLRTLSSIVTCLRMNFYTGALFNPFQLLHCCFPHPHTFHLYMMHSMPSLDLMAVAPLLIRAKEEEEVGEVTLTTIITCLPSLNMETMGGPLGRTPRATTATSTSRNKEGNISGLGRLDANFAATSDTLHSIALSLCIIGIKPQPTSSLVMLQQQILSPGSPIQVQINMLPLCRYDSYRPLS